MSASVYQQMLEQGQRQVAELRFVDAVGCFKQAVEAAPAEADDDGVRARLASCYLVLGQWDQAERQLKKVLERKQQDKVRVEALLSIAELHDMRGEPGLAGEYLAKAQELAATVETSDVTTAALAKMAEHAGRTGAVSRAKEHIDQALLEAEKLPESAEKRRLQASLWTQLGLYNFRLARIKEAESQVRKGLECLGEDPPCLTRAQVLRYLGVISGLRRKHRSALMSHLDALSIYKKASCPFGQAKVYESIGRTFLALNRMEEAIFSFKRCESLCVQLGANAELATLYGKLGQVYMLREDYHNAATFFRKDLELSIRFRNPYALGYSYRNLGQCLVQLENLEEAIRNLRESLALFGHVEDTFNVARVQMDLCQAYIRRGQATEAALLCSQARDMFREHKMFKELSFLLCLSGSIARLEGEHEEAARRLNESILSLAEHGDSAWLAEAYYQRGLLSKDRGQRKQAVADLKNAVRVARRAGLSRETGRYLEELKSLDERELYLTWMEGLRDAHIPSFEERLTKK